MSLTGVRVAHAGKAEGWTPRFTRAAFVAEFGEGADISDVAVLTRILNGLGLDAAAVLTAAGSDTVKNGLKARTAEAQAKGIYGAPSFVTETGELFWGDDRLEKALAWACRTA